MLFILIMGAMFVAWFTSRYWVYERAEFRLRLLEVLSAAVRLEVPLGEALAVPLSEVRRSALAELIPTPSEIMQMLSGVLTRRMVVAISPLIVSGSPCRVLEDGCRDRSRGAFGPRGACTSGWFRENCGRGVPESI